MSQLNALDLESDVYDAAMMAEASSVYIADVLDQTVAEKEGFRSLGVKVPEGYVLILDRTLTRIAFLATMTSTLCDKAYDHYK